VGTASAEAFAGAGGPDREAAGARLSELFARHGAAVLGLCRVLLRQREEAEDAAQQAFLSAYRSLLNGAEPRHPAAWLATIARNECRARIAQRMREPLLDRQADPPSPLPDPVAEAAAQADLTTLWRAVGDLPRRQRKALLLREFSGLSYRELAFALAVSEETVESLLFRARRELRLRLQPAAGSFAVAPLAAIRAALSRAIGGLPDPSSAGAVAGLSSTPLVAKLAAGAVVVAVAGGTVAAVDSGPARRVTAVQAADAATGPGPPRAAAQAAALPSPVFRPHTSQLRPAPRRRLHPVTHAPAPPPRTAVVPRARVETTAPRSIPPTSAAAPVAPEPAVTAAPAAPEPAAASPPVVAPEPEATDETSSGGGEVSEPEQEPAVTEKPDSSEESGPSESSGQSGESGSGSDSSGPGSGDAPDDSGLSSGTGSDSSSSGPGPGGGDVVEQSGGSGSGGGDEGTEDGGKSGKGG